MAQQKTDSGVNYAFLSVSLAAVSLFTFFFTSLPAVILGIIALVKKDGSKSQAIIGITLGLLGPILLVTAAIIVWQTVFSDMYKQQNAVPTHVSTQLQATTKALDTYRQENGALPVCDSGQECSAWDTFTAKYDITIPGRLEFSRSYSIPDKPAGTVVYASKTQCFINTPITPLNFEDDEVSEQEKPDQFAALVYFHDAGRACFDSNP